VRVRKQFRRLSAADDERAVPIDEYVELPAAAREGRVPFVHATDDDRRLVKVACSPSIVALVEDRQRYWQTLQYLAGRHEAAVEARLRAELEALQARYEQALAQQETSLDDLARAMSELAVAGGAPAGLVGHLSAAGGLSPAAPPAASTAAVGILDAPIHLDPADQARCTDCGTCYQELPQLFRKVTVVADGEARAVAELVPGALDGLDVTPELRRRMDRVKATCDAEIIR
jgi:pyruvate-ferredoxin/flavodoxin oxidoreductase